jgi:hypothetical protein
MFGKHNWVGGQGLTRKSSAIRHNSNLHSGNAMIVRPFDYVIGRITGKFLPPLNDPLLYKRVNNNSKRRQNTVFSGPIHYYDNYEHNNNSNFNNNNELSFNKTYADNNIGRDDNQVERRHVNMPQPPPKQQYQAMKNNNNMYRMPWSSSYPSPLYTPPKSQQQLHKTVNDDDRL